MASEIRVNKINSSTGVGTITLSPTGVDISGITTSATLRATTGIVTSLTAVSSAKVGSGVTLSPDGDGFFTGVCTATSFSGDGSNLTGISGVTINNNADNRIITGSGTANTLEGEANLTYNGTNLTTKGADNSTSANSGGTGLLIQNTNNTNNNQNFLGFYDSTGTSSAAIIAQHENHSSTTGNLQFGTRNAGTYNEVLRLVSGRHILTQGITGTSFNNDSANVKILEVTGDGTVGEYGQLSLSGNQNSGAAVGAIKFINRENSNSSSGANANSRNLATIDVYADTSDSNAGDDCGGYMRFVTKSDGGGNSERMRLLGNGKLLIGGTSDGSGLGNLQVTDSGNDSVVINGRATNGSYTSAVIHAQCDRNTSNSSYSFFNAVIPGVQTRFLVYDSGNVVNVNNSYGSISDSRLKENIEDASSQWNDIKGLKFRKFNFTEESGSSTHKQLGLVAQETETVCPNLVEDQNIEIKGEKDTYKSIKTSVLYMKGMKALQEAMARIETLEAEVAALKGS